MISVKFSYFLDFQRTTYLLFDTPGEAIEYGVYLLRFRKLASIEISWETSTTKEHFIINNTKKV